LFFGSKWYCGADIPVRDPPPRIIRTEGSLQGCHNIRIPPTTGS
jgi:hypothetical protein